MTKFLNGQNLNRCFTNEDTRANKLMKKCYSKEWELK